MDDEQLDYESDRSEYDDSNHKRNTDDVSDEDSQLQKDEDQLDYEKNTMEAFGLNKPNDMHLYVNDDERRALRKELGVTEASKLDSVYVYGVESMDEYNIMKIFSDFRASRVCKKDNVAIVQFQFPQEAAAMMLNMSKMMRRVRSRKTADEEGEVASDDDHVEDGQILQEKGDDVELVEGLQPDEKGIVVGEKKSDFVTVDVGSRDIPFGKWRVLTKHVPAEKFIIVRYPTKKEYNEILPNDNERQRFQKLGKDFWTVDSSANRGGLNLFDREGKELEWDYEHDTRFYDEKEDDVKKIDKPKLPSGIKVRGRGAVKCGFLFGEGSSSLASDDTVSSNKRKANDDGKDYEKDDVVARMGTAAHAIRPGRVERPMSQRIKMPRKN